jgi:hypothetical protein
VGALSHYLEDEGIATTQISLVREHTAAIGAPRALWVPYILGRPFGVPGDAAFQRRVLLAVLNLLEAESGPVLADYDEEAPADSGAADASESFACPVSFSKVIAGDDASALQQEITELAPWHDIAVQRRGRTTAALSGLSAEQAARFITDFIADPQKLSFRDDLARGLALRLACEDIKAFYFEAVSAQPGQSAAKQAHEWFWRQTVAGRVFLDLREVCLGHADASVYGFGSNNLVPRAILHTLGAVANT